MTTAILNTIIIYAKDMQRTAQFYQQHFGLISTGEIVDGLIELSAESGVQILIHQAAKSIKLGQVAVKLSFSVTDVEHFIQHSTLNFGKIHQANGYQFANCKDPDGNSISISSRAYRVQ